MHNMNDQKLHTNLTDLTETKCKSRWSCWRQLAYLMNDPFPRSYMLILSTFLCALVAAIAIILFTQRRPFMLAILLPFSLSLPVYTMLARFVVPGGTVDKRYQNPCLNGKVAIVTGGNTGIGKATAQQLAVWGCHVILACRSRDKGEAAAEEIRTKATGGKILIEVEVLDLADLNSVRKFASRCMHRNLKVDFLINNAGVFIPSLQRTEQGHELHFGVNHLGHFLLTLLFLDVIKSRNGRIINVSSMGHVFEPHFSANSVREVDSLRFDRYKLYGLSKTCNIVFTKALAKKLGDEGSNVGVFSLNPGAVMTKLLKDMTPFVRLATFLMKTPEQGCQTILHLCVAPREELRSGEYYQDCEPLGAQPETDDAGALEELWKFSEELVKQYL